MTGSAALAADQQATMLADIASLTPTPAILPGLLAALGYQPPQPIGTGLFAPGSAAPTLLFPFYDHASLTIRREHLIGTAVLRSAAIAAGLAALRSVEARPSLLFVQRPGDVPPGIRPDQVISMQGGVVPRIWRGCFGRLDMLIRIVGRVAHPGQPNAALNAIEDAVPALQALMQLKAQVHDRTFGRPQVPDSPLRPRVTIGAVHGGQSALVLPTTCDVMVSRRYDPAESMAAARAEIEDTVRSATRDQPEIEFSVIEHKPPVPDPDLPGRTREERALAAGWGWPQVPFCPSEALLPGATIFGGLERPGSDPEGHASRTTLDDIAALARSLRILLDGL